MYTKLHKNTFNESLILSASRSQSVKGSSSSTSSKSKLLLRLAIPSQIISKVLCATPPAQTVQYLPCLLVGVSCKSSLYEFGKVSSCVHLIPGARVLRSICNMRLIRGLELFNPFDADNFEKGQLMTFDKEEKQTLCLFFFFFFATY